MGARGVCKALDGPVENPKILTSADSVFRDELDALASRLDLRICHVMSNQPDWTGEKGKVDEALLKRLLTERDMNARVFLCGPPLMMKFVTASLRRAGFRRAMIHTERFAL